MSAIPNPEYLLRRGLFPELYNNLKPDELDFIKTWTGIEDEGQLREHIMDVQRRAYAVSI